MFLARSEGRVFDDRRHSILQSELKSLYVGLTRARERVWIWEESSNGCIMEVTLAESVKMAIKLIDPFTLGSSHRI